MTTVTTEQVEKAVRTIPGVSYLLKKNVQDVSDSCPGSKFHIVVVSNDFEGKPLLDRHRAVNTAIKDLMGSIHAVTMKTWTEAQYEKEKAKQQ